MKKFIAVLLSILMCFSVVTVAFAEETSDQGETTTQAPAIDTEKLLDEACQWALGMSYEEFNALDDAEKWVAIQNMDMEKVITIIKVAKPIFKFAKVAIKLINVLDKLGFVDLSDIKGAITNAILDAVAEAISNGTLENTSTQTTTTTEPISA